MSTLIVEVCCVEEILPHPNADRLERVRVKNWWCVAPIGQYHVGDKTVYVPPDAVLPAELGERWGIAKYCAPVKDSTDLRVRASRFRGIASFGTLQNLDDPSWEVGKDVREHFGITKYEPPLKTNDGEAAPAHENFHTYTEIENLGNYPSVLNDGEEVIVTEKLHGTNCRVGFINTGFDDETEAEKWEFMAGSHAINRKPANDKGTPSRYWWPLTEGNTEECRVRDCLFGIMYKENAKASVILFGEIFGAGVQDMQYGQKGIAFRVFDISVDGNYLSYEKKKAYLDRFGVPMVPILYEGSYSLAKMDELVDGPTTICTAEQIKESFKGREGIVITPKEERYDRDNLQGRTILKYISADYHDRRNKNRSEDH